MRYAEVDTHTLAASLNLPRPSSKSWKELTVHVKQGHDWLLIPVLVLIQRTKKCKLFHLVRLTPKLFKNRAMEWPILS